MPVLIKIAAKAGWNAVNKYYSKVMQLIGQGWSVDQISKWLSNHQLERYNIVSSGLLNIVDVYKNQFINIFSERKKMFLMINTSCF